MRKRTYRVDSEQVQGKGSWVELVQMPHGECQRFATLNRDDPEIDTLVRRHIAAWNWTDDEGEELPTPAVVEDLSELERSFLINALLYPLSHLAKN